MDEVLFASSQIDFATIHLPTPPPPPATKRLSTPIADVAGLSHANTHSEDNGCGEEDEVVVEPAATKHLILLDLLALMLVTDAKSDGAATMLTMGPRA